MEFSTDEKLLETYILNYLPSEGGRYNGNLHITDKKVYFEGKMHIGTGGVSDAEGGIQFQKSAIKSVEMFKAMWIFNRVRVKLIDNTEHIFDRGMMPVKKLVSLIQQN